MGPPRAAAGGRAGTAAGSGQNGGTGRGNGTGGPAARRTTGGTGPGSPRRFNFDKRWLVFLPALGIVILAFAYARIAVTMPSPSRVIAGAQGIEIFDRNGDLVFSFGDEPGSSRVVPLEEISPLLINATLATEDAEFWDNPGVNPKGLARAVYENLAFWERGGLFKGSGGSSITQQLAKNLYIKPEDRAKRSPMRKLNETLIAFELSRRYPKEQILEWYLSNVYYGNGVYGIESASFRYFSKPPAELTLAEAAMLAGLPRSPIYYDPVTNYEAALERQEQVLGLMVRHKFITQAEKDEALIRPLAINEGRVPGSRDEGDLTAPHFAVYVRDLLPALLGHDRVEGSLKVTTSIDLEMQRMAETTVTRELARIGPQVGATNAALVAMDPRTGEILAMVGSPDFFNDAISGQVNNATSLNQPGSTMKPVTYLATFLKGWTPNTQIVDERIVLGSGDAAYTVPNADGRYRGQVTVRTALGSSLNPPAIKAIEYAGLEYVYTLARRMGVTSLKELGNYGPSFTLGGVDASLLDMTYVYAVLANRGQQSGMRSVLGLGESSRPLDPISVLKVEDSSGNIIWQASPRTERIVPENETYQITDILADDAARASMFGRNSALNLPRPAAVKSGSSDESRDTWAIGYTPQLVTGVWVGNANNAPMPGASSTSTAAPIWRSFMLTALEGEPVLQFTRPGEEERRRQEPTAAPATATPQPTVVQPSPAPPSPTPRQEPTPVPVVTNTPVPTRTAEPTNTPRPTNTPQPQTGPPGAQPTPTLTGGGGGGPNSGPGNNRGNSD